MTEENYRVEIEQIKNDYDQIEFVQNIICFLLLFIIIPLLIAICVFVGVGR